MLEELFTILDELLAELFKLELLKELDKSGALLDVRLADELLAATRLLLLVDEGVELSAELPDPPPQAASVIVRLITSALLHRMWGRVLIVIGLQLLLIMGFNV